MLHINFISIYIYIYIFDKEKKEKLLKSQFSDQVLVLVIDPKPKTIIWLLTKLITNHLCMTKRVKLRVNWVGHMYNQICWMSRKFYLSEIKIKEQI